MEKIEIKQEFAYCDKCEKVFTLDELREICNRDIFRLNIGDIIPSGRCKICNGFCKKVNGPIQVMFIVHEKYGPPPRISWISKEHFYEKDLSEEEIKREVKKWATIFCIEKDLPPFEEKYLDYLKVDHGYKEEEIEEPKEYQVTYQYSISFKAKNDEEALQIWGGIDLGNLNELVNNKTLEEHWFGDDYTLTCESDDRIIDRN